jgi:hypothetical protein
MGGVLVTKLAVFDASAVVPRLVVEIASVVRTAVADIEALQRCHDCQ